jgi:hypothetical protein
MMKGDEFVQAVSELQKQHGLRDDQVASALAGIIVNLCRRNQLDPMRLMRWAVVETANIRCPHGYLFVELVDGTERCEPCVAEAHRIFGKTKNEH